jgi:hypothetical protein
MGRYIEETMQEKNAVKPTPVPKRAHALNIIALTQEEAGHALNTARVRKILIGLNFDDHFYQTVWVSVSVPFWSAP